MMLTHGAIKALTNGAEHPDIAINAIVDGVPKDAGQICAEEDGLVRHKQIDYDEYQPVLQVKDVIWTKQMKFATPMKHWIVTDDEDGDNAMVMLASTRKDGKDGTYRKFMKTWGQSGKNCKLGKGRRFKLLTYTTKMTREGSLFNDPVPVIHVENIRVEPKSRKQKKIYDFIKKNNIPEANSSDEEVPTKLCDSPRY